MILHVKGMISHSCKTFVKNIITEKGYHLIKVELGEVELQETLPKDEFLHIKALLIEAGFDLLNNHNEILAEQIKDAIIDTIHYNTDLLKINFSECLALRLHHNYTYLSNVFSKTTGYSISTYVILQKIEYVKELLLDNELNLSEIAFKLHYSSASHLCNQFKKITGMTPLAFRNCKNNSRICLENICVQLNSSRSA